MIGRKSPYRWIFEEILNEKLTICVSSEILLEYEEILEQLTTPEIARNVMSFLSVYPSVEKIDVYYNWDVIEADPDDNKFVDCAVAGEASYLVSNDRHFNIIRELDFPYVRVLKGKEFEEVWKKEEDN